MFEAAQILYTVIFIVDDVVNALAENTVQESSFMLDDVDRMYLRVR